MKDTSIKAVVFDWAGTIIDYGCMAPVKAFKKSFDSLGINSISYADIRGPMGLNKKEHIENAVNVPLDLFNTIYMMELGRLDKNKIIIVYGRTISRRYAEQVSRKLVLRGHSNTIILKGGLSAWKKKGYPVKS